jgi:hypothetical protein
MNMMLKKYALVALFAAFGATSCINWMRYPQLAEMNKEGLVSTLKNESNKSILRRNFIKIGAIKQELWTRFGVRVDKQSMQDQYKVAEYSREFMFSWDVMAEKRLVDKFEDEELERLRQELNEGLIKRGIMPRSATEIGKALSKRPAGGM